MNPRTSKIIVLGAAIILATELSRVTDFIWQGAKSMADTIEVSEVSKISPEELCSQAKRVSVQVLGESSSGSGVILQKQEPTTYILITNGHVIEEDKEFFEIKTSDGKTHQASLVVRYDHGQITGKDLAILQFESENVYPIATIAQSTQVKRVMAAGYPNEASGNTVDLDGFSCTKISEVSRRLDKPMQEGYQLGYYVNVPKGMSGGPLFDEYGQVVGINGMGNPMIFLNEDLYLYKNGERVINSLGIPPNQALELLSSSSWAIPSETVVYYFPKGYELSFDASDSSQ